MSSEQKTKNISRKSKIFFKLTSKKVAKLYRIGELLSRFFRSKTKKIHLLGKEY